MTARAFTHPFARRFGIGWNKVAKIPALGDQLQHDTITAKQDALVKEIRGWVDAILDNLALADGGKALGVQRRTSQTACATTLVHCMSGRGFLQNGHAKEDHINDIFLMSWLN